MSVFGKRREGSHKKMSCATLERGGVRGRLMRRLVTVPLFACLGFPVAGSQRAKVKESTKAGAAWRADSGELQIAAADVQLLLIAPDGKKTGYDPKAKRQVRGIPEASYFEDALAEFDSGRVDRSTTQKLQVQRPRVGKYRLVVSPGYLEDGQRYEVRVKLYREDSSLAANARIDGTVKGHEAAEYDVGLGGCDGKVLTVRAAEREK